MNKEKLISEIAVTSGLSVADVGKVLKGYEAVVEKALKAGDCVVSTGFGTFLTQKTTARNGRNPSTGAPMIIPSKQVVKFRPGKRLKFTS